MENVSDLGEGGVIRRLTAGLPGRDDVVIGTGDDCAVVRVENAEHDLLLTSDPLIEGTHFDADAPPELVGRKALGRTLSDIAAMGGEPLWSLVNVVAPAGMPMRRLDGIYRGMSALAEEYGVALVGGDTARGDLLHLHVFTVGRVPRGSAITRAGARPGDRIFVTGELGGSRAGKHMDFTPRIAEGLWLREGTWAHSLIDLSDGLAGDLRQILAQSGVGALLDLEMIPLSPAALAMEDGRTPLEHALTDGEDFELLFTVAGDRCKALESLWEEAFDLPCRCIGTITDRSDVLECLDAEGRRSVYDSVGFDHFRTRS